MQNLIHVIIGGCEHCDDEADEDTVKIRNRCKYTISALLHLKDNPLNVRLNKDEIIANITFDDTLAYVSRYFTNIMCENTSGCTTVLNWLIQMKKSDIIKTILCNIPSTDEHCDICSYLIKYIPDNPSLFELALNIEFINIFDTDSNEADWIVNLINNLCESCYTTFNIPYLNILNKLVKEKEIPKLTDLNSFTTPSNITSELVDAVLQLHDICEHRTNNNNRLRIIDKLAIFNVITTDSFAAKLARNILHSYDTYDYGRFCIRLNYFTGFKQYVDKIDKHIIMSDSSVHNSLLVCYSSRLYNYINYMLDHLISNESTIVDETCKIFHMFNVPDLDKIENKLILNKYLQLFRLEKNSINDSNIIDFLLWKI